jgi:immune inhibitor A
MRCLKNAMTHHALRWIPPSPELQEKILRTKDYLAMGKPLPTDPLSKETIVDVLDLQTLTLISSRPKRLHTAEPNLAPIMGTRRALVLLVDFSDKVATQTQQHYQELLFSSGTYAGGSLRDFYQEISYNKLIISGEISGQGSPTPGWYRASQAYSAYTHNAFGTGSYPNNAQKLVEEVVDQAAPFVNFAEYDNDGDGFVDALFVVHAGQGAEVTGNKNDIWSHQWAISPKIVDGVKVQTYMIEPEDGRVGVFSHELAHAFGLPDLYDTDYSSAGTGNWDLMAGGSWNGGGSTPAHPTAYCKVKLGWVNPVVIFNSQQSITLKPYATTDRQIYKLPIGTIDSTEYFLLSNRQPMNFDALIPGTGLLIEHIDETKTSNTDETHYLVDIEQCDGKQDLNKNANRGDAGDLYPGTTNAFTASTVPSSKTYAGTDSKVLITDIKRMGNDITANVKVGDEGWLYNTKVLSTYVHCTSQWAWVNIESIGWRRIKDGAPEGVTHMLDACCEAVEKNRQIHAYVDGNFIYTMCIF